MRFQCCAGYMYPVSQRIYCSRFTTFLLKFPLLPLRLCSAASDPILIVLIITTLSQKTNSNSTNLIHLNKISSQSVSDIRDILIHAFIKRRQRKNPVRNSKYDNNKRRFTQNFSLDIPSPAKAAAKSVFIKHTKIPLYERTLTK